MLNLSHVWPFSLHFGDYLFVCAMAFAVIGGLYCLTPSRKKTK